jgi:ribonuclease D
VASSSVDHPLEYLDTAPGVDHLTDELRGVTELAIDTEGASFHRFVDRIYLLQLSTRDRSAIVDPLPIGTPAGLGVLIEDPAVEKVFHDADYDLRLLRQDYGWQVRNVFDTRIAAQLIGLRAFGLAALLERYFDVKLDKQYQRADWSQRPLTKGMLDYASQDTRWLLGLRDQLHDELTKLGRMHWAREEFGRLEAVRWEGEEASPAFLKMKGARDLNRRELAVLREVVAWRDVVAGELDRATFRVMSNETLFSIARLQPRTRDALAAIKGMPRGILEHRGGDLLEAVERGLAVPDAELPRFPRAPRWDRDPDFDDRLLRVKAVRDGAAERLALDPGVLCSRDRLETVSRMNPHSLEELATIPGLRGWQIELLGEDFLRAVETNFGAAGNGGGATASPAAAAPVAAPIDDVAGAVVDDGAEPESPYRDD